MQVRNGLFGRLANKGIETKAATFTGITVKTLILTLVTIISGVLSVYFGMRVTTVNGYDTIGMATPLWIAFAMSGVVGFIAAMIGLYIPKTASWMSFVYAISQGIFLGVISAIFEILVPGVVMLAMATTLTIFVIMLLLYSNKTFRSRVYIFKVMMILLFGALGVGTLVLLFSLFGGGVDWWVYALIGLALLLYSAFMLVFDFDYASSIVTLGLDKRYEWVASFSLLITLLMVYLRALRFLGIVLSRNRR